jgi:outer membrane protein assembly factor BamE (lipoprotein component of BamABCDE complex)
MQRFNVFRQGCRSRLLPGLAVAIALLAGCSSASRHAADVQRGLEADGRMTVGLVQKEIRVGMSGADVASTLGSPNIVSTDENRDEVWIYDRIATDRAFSTSEAGVAALILDTATGAESTSQRTLTVVIKFNKEGKVRDFAYHTSRF